VRRCVPLLILCPVSSDQEDFWQDLSKIEISAGQLCHLPYVCRVQMGLQVSSGKVSLAKTNTLLIRTLWRCVLPSSGWKRIGSHLLNASLTFLHLWILFIQKWTKPKSFFFLLWITDKKNEICLWCECLLFNIMYFLLNTWFLKGNTRLLFRFFCFCVFKNTVVSLRPAN